MGAREEGEEVRKDEERDELVDGNSYGEQLNVALCTGA